MKTYTNQEKQTILERLHSGESVTKISNSEGVPKSTIYFWLEQETTIEPEITKRHYRDLLNKVERLEGMIEILQTVNCTVHSPLDERLVALEDLQGKYSVHMLCDALQVSRGTFYNYINRGKHGNTLSAQRREELKPKVQHVFNESNQIFGADKIAAVLKEQGYEISPKMAKSIMQELGLVCMRQNSKKIYQQEKRHLHNELKQQFSVSRPNEVWVGDITQFPYNEKIFYMSTIIDLYARKVVAYKISERGSTHLVKMTFKAAYESRNPEGNLMFHSDRGGQYVSQAFRSYLLSLGVEQSASRPHVPYDNSVIESFFSSLKREELYRRKYRSEKEFKAAIDNYVKFYNEKRPHRFNQYRTPCKKEEEYWLGIED